MGAFKEIYDESVYLPEETVDQMEFVGLVSIFKCLQGSAETGGHSSEWEAEAAFEIATPIRSLAVSLNTSDGQSQLQTFS